MNQEIIQTGNIKRIVIFYDDGNHAINISNNSDMTMSSIRLTWTEEIGRVDLSDLTDDEFNELLSQEDKWQFDEKNNTIKIIEEVPNG